VTEPDPRGALFRRFPGLTVPHVSLSEYPGPTPVTPLLLPELAGRPIYWKHDGLYGGPYGGNKARKLEFVVADAVARRKRVILTMGGLGTHHGLATAIYAARAAMDTVLMLLDQPLTEHVREQLARLAASGARLYRTHGPIRTVLALPFLMARHLRWSGGWLRFPYFLMVGGSSPVGTLGYVQAALELAEQVARGEVPAPARIVVALGSGGTAAGLVLGLRLAGLPTRVHAVAVTDMKPIGAPLVARLANRTARLLERHGADTGRQRVAVADFDVDFGFVGAGYGHVLAAAEDARRDFLALTGTRMEGVYTGKTFAGLLARARQGALGAGPILYWHTYDARLQP
jgi:D-cysteine desulfhydrase